MSATSFGINYDTRDKLWPIMFQNATVPGKTHDTPEERIVGTTGGTLRDSGAESVGYGDDGRVLRETGAESAGYTAGGA